MRYLYVRSFWKLVRANSFPRCYLIITFNFAHGVLKFLKSVALAGIFFIHLCIFGGWVERSSQSTESGIFSSIFFFISVALSTLFCFLFQEFSSKRCWTSGFGPFTPRLVYIFSYLFYSYFYFLIVCSFSWEFLHLYFLMLLLIWGEFFFLIIFPNLRASLFLCSEGLIFAKLSGYHSFVVFFLHCSFMWG